MQAKDGSIGGAGQHPVYYGISLQLPIITDCGPHDPAQAEAALGLAEPEPAHAEWCSQQYRREAGDIAYGALSTGELPVDKLRRMKAEERMGVAVIADLVAPRVHGAGDLRQALYVNADLEKSSRHAMFIEQF
jgi:hypothetical protein